MKKSDILWYNTSTGETQVWYMDGHRLVDRGTVLGLDGNAALIGLPFSIVGVGDMNMVLRPTPRTDKPSIPLPPAPAPSPALARRTIQDMQDEQDFKGVLQAIRVRYPR